MTRAGVAIGVSLLLSACGNAYEHIAVGEWRQVGQPQAPVSPTKGEFVVTTRAEGTGPVAQAGDLVKARVMPVSSGESPDRPTLEQKGEIVWVWTGREPVAANEEQVIADLDTFGRLGSPRARATLIGRRLHEWFEIQLPPDAEGSGDQLAVRGIIEEESAKLGRSAEINGQQVTTAQWPGLALARNSSSKTAAAIEVLDICPARLWRREATMTQFGFIPKTGDFGYDLKREGTLGWTAIDAQCPAPVGPIRFQAGPLYHPSGKASRLAGWGSSYIRLRPPQQYPDEWAIIPKGPVETINERMAPVLRQTFELEAEARRERDECQYQKKCEPPEQTAQRQRQLKQVRAAAAQQKRALECELRKIC